MKVVAINIVHNGSTGHIMLNISKLLEKNGDETKTFSARSFSRKYVKMPPAPQNHSYFGSYLERGIHMILGMYMGLNGLFSYFGTRKIIRECKRISPDVIHLHNLHAFCVNLPQLFRYIKKNNISVVWTLHDCWAFTGHCPHFIMAKCNKWQTGCHHCPQPEIYPKMYLDTSKKMYKLKKKWFTGVNDMTLVTPSQWLADLVGKSFLKDYPVKVINNGIDLSVFKPSESDFRNKYNCVDKHILLGVAFDWGVRKGLDVFVELAGRLPEDYQIVLVGTDDNVDKQLPSNVISIHRTQNQSELAEIYTAADLFVNPTREEVFGLVNVEALACGTPVLTFRTGGSPECIDASCGSVVEVDDIFSMENEILRICTEKPYSKEACLERAKKFDMNERFEEYVKLYEEVDNR